MYYLCLLESYLVLAANETGGGETFGGPLSYTHYVRRYRKPIVLSGPFSKEWAEHRYSEVSIVDYFFQHICILSDVELKRS